MSKNNVIIRARKITVLFLFKLFPASHVQVVFIKSGQELSIANVVQKEKLLKDHSHRIGSEP